MLSKSFGDIFTFSRASAGARINSAGSTETIAANQPRFDYDPVTLQPKGILIEEQRTNNLQMSELQHDAGYPKTVSGIQMSIVGSGNSMGFKHWDIRFHGTATETYFYASLGGADPFNQSSPIVFSLYVDFLSAVGSLPSFRGINLADYAAGWTSGENVGFPLTSVGTDSPGAIYECKKGERANRAVANADLTFGCAVGDVFDFTVRVGRAQLEEGLFATSYIPTSGSQVTRAADVCSINTLSPWYKQTEGSIYSDVAVDVAVPAGKSPQILQGAGTSGNSLSIGFLTANAASLEVVSGGVNQCSMYPYSADLHRKTSVAFKQDSFAISVNGSSVVSDVAGSIPVIDRILLGGGTVLNGHIRKLLYYPKRLSDAQLQALTA